MTRIILFLKPLVASYVSYISADKCLFYINIYLDQIKILLLNVELNLIIIVLVLTLLYTIFTFLCIIYIFVNFLYYKIKLIAYLFDLKLIPFYIFLFRYYKWFEITRLIIMFVNIIINLFYYGCLDLILYMDMATGSDESNPPSPASSTIHFENPEIPQAFRGRINMGHLSDQDLQDQIAIMQASINNARASQILPFDLDNNIEILVWRQYLNAYYLELVARNPIDDETTHCNLRCANDSCDHTGNLGPWIDYRGPPTPTIAIDEGRRTECCSFHNHGPVYLKCDSCEAGFCSRDCLRGDVIPGYAAENRQSTFDDLTVIQPNPPAPVTNLDEGLFPILPFIAPPVPIAPPVIIAPTILVNVPIPMNIMATPSVDLLQNTVAPNSIDDTLVNPLVNTDVIIANTLINLVNKEVGTNSLNNLVNIYKQVNTISNSNLQNKNNIPHLDLDLD